MQKTPIDSLIDTAGALHVHTIKSNGAGTLAEVVSAAERAGLTFLVLTDHGTRGYGTEGAEGWHGNVLVICGEEVSVGSGRFLVIGHDGPLGTWGEDVVETMTRIHARGGLPIALPPESETGNVGAAPAKPVASVASGSSSNRDPNLRAEAMVRRRVKSLPVDYVHGWEFWSGLEDWARGRADRKPMTDPFSRVEHVGLRGPQRSTIRMWDALTRQGKVYGYSGLNAHGRSWTSTAPGAALPYETLFRALATHVLTPPLPRGSAQEARAVLLDAMRRGHFYTAHCGLLPCAGFRFWADQPDGTRVEMGGSGVLHPRMRLRMVLPTVAQIRVLHNGAEAITAEGEHFDFPTVGAGVYRVEVWYDRRPWIFSNPIWLEAPSGEELERQRQESRRAQVEQAVEGYDDLVDLAT